MYPAVRLAREYLRHRNAPPLAVGEAHVSHHRCWPQDLDVWMELNNGRTLTLYDLGRAVLSRRTGLVRAMRAHRWGMAMAGNSVRFRRRIRAFDRVEMQSRLVTWDDRFLYIEQSLWHADGDCANHALMRVATTGPTGIVPTAQVARAIGHAPEPPRAPNWIAAWIAAEAERPWPPHRA